MAKGFDKNERISEYDPRQAEKLLRMTNRQLETYVANSKRNWEKRVNRGGDLASRYV